MTINYAYEMSGIVVSNFWRLRSEYSIWMIMRYDKVFLGVERKEKFWAYIIVPCRQHGLKI